MIFRGQSKRPPAAHRGQRGDAFRIQSERRQLLHAVLVGFDHLLDHLAAHGTGLLAGQVAVVALLQVCLLDTSQEKVKYFSVEDNVLTLTLRGEGEDTSTLKYHLADFNVRCV